MRTDKSEKNRTVIAAVEQFEQAGQRLPLRRLLPNAITILAICAGLSSLRFGFANKFELAVLTILLAAVLDGLDGAMARLLRAETALGAQLDSLADFLNFGVAPVLIVYSWSLYLQPRLGWVVVLVYAVCCALRLARFNVEKENERHSAKPFFSGVPSPAGGILILWPLAADFAGAFSLRDWPWLVGCYVIGVSFLMVSRLPTFSLKNLPLRVHRDYVVPLLFGLGVAAAALWTLFWSGVMLAGIGYWLLLPIGYAYFTKSWPPGLQWAAALRRLFRRTGRRILLALQRRGKG